MTKKSSRAYGLEAAETPGQSPTRCVALLRGINVGRAKRVAMADLRVRMKELGFSGVRTPLNSGNVVFQAQEPDTHKTASAIQTAIKRHFGFAVPVIVHTARELDSIVDENPLPEAIRDPSKFLVAFVDTPASLTPAKRLLLRDWDPDERAIGRRSAYLWCANGIIPSKLMKAFARVMTDATTTRNWATVLRLQAAASLEVRPNHRLSKR